MKILLVEDDPWYGQMLEFQLELNDSDQVTRVTSGKECLVALSDKPQVVLLDYSLPDMTGEEILKKIKSKHPYMGVIMISGQEDVEIALDLLRQGADEYFVKNEETIERIRHAFTKMRERNAMQEELETLRAEVRGKYDFRTTIKGNSPQVERIFTLMEKAAKSNIVVSIQGETGTGKELVANAVHYNSARSKQALVAVNVAAIPSELIESELFGYEKGAFTGATQRKLGKFEEANKGTLFLDEIGEMPPAMQSKLLRVLQEKELVRIGGNQVVKVDFRLIIATHKNLLEEVKKGEFRQDLYYRLLGLSIELPPLRERRQDIVVLSKHFLEQYAKENKVPQLKMTEEARTKMMNYSFPGNIRELKAVIDLASVMSDGETIQVDDIILSDDDPMQNFLATEDTLKGYTRKIVQYYMKKYDTNIDVVSEKLDIGKSTIYKMRKDGEID